jgi:hypothetical protein
MKKNLELAFILGFFPGLGHFYLNKKVTGFLYGIVFTGLLFLSLIMYILEPWDTFFLIFLLFAFIVGAINFIHLMFKIKKYNRSGTESISSLNEQSDQGQQENHVQQETSSDNERFFTILLSLIPGLGHFQLGLMNRGLTLLLGFFGLITMIFFVTVISNQDSFLVFLGALPIIWIYSFFDAIQMLNKKQRGEELVDRTILEDLETTRDDGKKSKMIATILSILPGAGHMYLGLQRRGLQLMAGFLFSIFILDTLRLSLFLFLIPIIWFYSFFDALQQVSRHGKEQLKDTPIITYLVNHQKWFGIGLIGLGIFYLFERVFLPILDRFISTLYDVYLMQWYHEFFQTTVVSFLLIAGGLKLLTGSKRKKDGEL